MMLEPTPNKTHLYLGREFRTLLSRMRHALGDVTESAVMRTALMTLARELVREGILDEAEYLRAQSAPPIVTGGNRKRLKDK